MAIELDGKSYETDEEGYLINLSDWNDQLANEMAKADGAALDENHWEVINFLREYADSGQWELLTEETDFDLRFSSRLATLSDAAMFRLYQSSSVMKNLRKSAQGVVLMCAYRRAA